MQNFKIFFFVYPHHHQLKKNGFTSRILPSTWNSASLPISSITQVSLDDTLTSSDSDSSDDDETHSWDQFAILFAAMLWEERGCLDTCIICQHFERHWLSEAIFFFVTEQGLNLGGKYARPQDL